jgi:predicted nuclease with TOPRIM domain
MSDQNTSGEGQNNSGEGTKVDVNEVMKRLEQLESTNKRLLDESKTWKKEAGEYKSKLDEVEKTKVNQSGDTAAQLEYEKKQREKFEKENKNLKNKTLDQNIRSAVAKYAKDVHSVDDVLAQSQYIKILKDGIDPENLTVDEDAAKDFVNKVLEAKPWLKRNIHQETVDTTRPNGKNVGSAKNYASMSSKEIMEDILKTGKI